ncbi:MAG: uracil-DNA glycosylase [Acidiferrobacterales bacterium]|nr:uracil-DNA glycosylase [Acidiferrobacterales bacterium]
MKTKQILEQLGIQQWRLKDSFKSANLTSGLELQHPEKQENLNQANENTTNQACLEKPLNSQIQSEPEITTETETAPQQELVEDPKLDWSSLVDRLNDNAHCRSCAMLSPILGEGSTTADWVFIFDSPTSRDIQQQQLLSGRVGQLFDAILLALDLDREDIYLSTVFKCPPSSDISQVAAQCNDLVAQQIKLIAPRVIVALGEFASQSMIKANEDLSQLRAHKQVFCDAPIDVIPTYGLMQMLDTPNLKEQVWHDLKAARSIVAS